MEGDTVFVVVVIVVVYGQAGGGIRRWRSEEIIEQNLIVLKIRDDRECDGPSEQA